VLPPDDVGWLPAEDGLDPPLDATNPDEAEPEEAALEPDAADPDEATLEPDDAALEPDDREWDALLSDMEPLDLDDPKLPLMRFYCRSLAG
jgi:hypothetical protein